MIDDPRSLAARLIAASPLAMSLEEALKQKRERRAALLASPPTALPAQVEHDFTAPAPIIPIVDAPLQYAQSFLKKNPPVSEEPPKPKSRKRPPGRRPIGELDDRHAKFRVVDGDVDK